MNIHINIMLVLSMGLFFYAPDAIHASNREGSQSINPNIIDPLERVTTAEKCIELNTKDTQPLCQGSISQPKETEPKPVANKEEPKNIDQPTPSKPADSNDSHIDPEVLDPLERIIASDKCIEVDSKEDQSVCKKIATIFENKEGVAANEEKARKSAELVSLVAGYPIEEMIPFMVEQRKEVAAYLIGIAKIESDWGRHSPSKNGQHCYNYWGYKGSYNLSPSGYSCFDSAEQAVEVVGNRIGELINKQINTPERMVVWKCGSSCAGHDPEGVKRWISNVKNYYTLSVN